MKSTSDTPEQQEIIKTLHDLNHAWVNGHPDQIGKYLHANVVFASPDLRQRMTGRENCVASYAEFCACAKILGFNESAYAVDVIGETAVVTYGFEIDYEMNGKTHHETGHDLFVFSREGGEWKAVWRTLVGLKA